MDLIDSWNLSPQKIIILIIWHLACNIRSHKLFRLGIRENEITKILKMRCLGNLSTLKKPTIQ